MSSKYIEQSRMESMIETLTNIFFGFWISFFYWQYVVLPRIHDGTISIDDTLYITAAFTVLAIIRQYFWRRFFANRIHITVIKWVKRVYE